MTMTPISWSLFLFIFSSSLISVFSQKLHLRATIGKSPTSTPAPPRPKVGNNNSVPLTDRLTAGHAVSPFGPRRFRRFKVWLPWYQSYTRWCFHTRAGKQCKQGDCCLWHMQCMVDLREQYLMAGPTTKIKRSEVDENWPDGVFGTGSYRERLAYGAADPKSLYYRLEVGSTRLAITLSQVPDCPCVEDTSSLDVTFAYCAQQLPGLKGVTRLPRKKYELRPTAEEERRKLSMSGFFSKSVIGAITDALAALCSLAAVVSTFLVCRCYYRKSGSSRLSNNSRWRTRRQQQAIDQIYLVPLPAIVESKKSPSQNHQKKKSQKKIVASEKNGSNSRRNGDRKENNAQSEKKSISKKSINGESIDDLITNSADACFFIKRNKRVEWATCPSCDCDFETRTGIACKLQRKSMPIDQAPIIRYFCSIECLRQLN